MRPILIELEASDEALEPFGLLRELNRCTCGLVRAVVGFTGDRADQLAAAGDLLTVLASAVTARADSLTVSEMPCVCTMVW